MNYSLFPEGYQTIGTSFAAQYYQVLQSDRNSVINFYHDEARMTYEGQEILGKPKIGEKFQSLGAQRIQVALTSVDSHPAENAVLIFVSGQLKCDEDPILPFSEVFYLRKFNEIFLISNSMFRLCLHNF